MNLKFTLCTALVGVLTATAPAFAKDKIFRASSSRQGGQVVNSYSNLGSVHVKKRAKVYQGAVTNVVPHVPLNVVYKTKTVAVAYSRPAGPAYNAVSTPAAAPGYTSAFTYAQSANQRLQERWGSYYRWDDAEKRWTPSNVAINALIEQNALRSASDVQRRRGRLDAVDARDCGGPGRDERL